MSIRTPSRRVALVLAVLSLHSATIARADDDELASYRERFRVGMEKYRAGQIAEAVQYWEAVYRELGAPKGYRVAFDLGRAYDSLGDSTRAAERYRAFLDEAAARRGAGAALEAIVETEVTEASARLEALAASKGRIAIRAGERPVVVQVDGAEARLAGFTAYVSPGEHSVTFRVGTEGAETRVLRLRAGEIVELAPLAPAEPALASPTTAAPPKLGSTQTAPDVDRPFSPAFLYVAGATTLASAVLPVLFYNRALGIKDRHDWSSDYNERARIEQQDYPNARTAAYVSLAIPLTLATATASLATIYFAGSKRRGALRVAPSIGLSERAAIGALRLRF